MNNPLVSITCLAFNHEQFLRQTFESFLMQETNFDYEIIVHDDASSDNTKEIIEEYVHNYPKIFKPIYQTENQYSKGIKPWVKFVYPKCNGKYIAFCEGDDYWTDPLKLQKQVDILEENEAYSACFHPVYWLENGKFKDVPYEPLIKKEYYDINDVLANILQITICSTVFRKKNIGKNIQLFEGIPYGDMMLHILNARSGFIKYIDEPMATYRRHKGGIYSGASMIERLSKTISGLETIKEKFNYHKNESLINRLNDLNNKKSLLDEKIKTEKYEMRKNQIAIKSFEKANESLWKNEFDKAKTEIEVYKKSINYELFDRCDNRKYFGPDISIIIVAYNTNDLLLEAIKSVKANNYFNYEIIVVDNGKNNKVIENLKKLELLYIKSPINLILSEGRNIGAHFAKGRILAFLDDDAVVPNNYVESIVQAFENYNISALRGKVLPKTENSNNQYASHYNLGEIPIPHTIDTEGNSAFLKERYLNVGGMNSLLFGGEGTELSYRLIEVYGEFTTIYWPNTIIYHDIANTNDKLETKKTRHLLMRSFMEYLYPDVFTHHLQLDKFRANLETKKIGETKIPRNIVEYNPSNESDKLKIAIIDSSNTSYAQPKLIYDELVKLGHDVLWLARPNHEGYQETVVPEGYTSICIANNISPIDINTGVEMELNHPPLERAYKSKADYIFVGDKTIYNRFFKNRKNACYMPYAVSTDIFKPLSEEEIYDVGFIGNIRIEERIRRIELIKKNFKCYVSSNDFLETANKMINKCKVIFNTSDGKEINMRVFEALAAGKPLVTEKIKYLDELFEDNKHLVMYKSEDEIVGKISELLNDEKERKIIGSNGHNEIVNKHTYKHRAEFIVETIKNYKSNSVVEKNANTPDRKLNILVATHHLSGYTGSEIFTLTLAKTLKSFGHDVTVYSKYIAELGEEFIKSNIVITDSLNIISNNKFDIAHVHHNISAIEIRAIFPNLPIVFLSQGILPFLEQPPIFNLGVSKYIAISEEIKLNLTSKGIPQNEIEIVGNIIDEKQFKTSRKVAEIPQNALVISSRIDNEKEMIIKQACLELNIGVEFIGGRFGDYDQETVRNKIEQSDIIFSLGRGAIEGMISERCVIIYDYLGADGMVTSNTYSEIKKNNFSGRRYGAKYTVEILKKEIEKYNTKEIENVKKLAIADYAASNVVAKLVNTYHEIIKNPKVDYPKNNLLLADFFRNVIIETRNYSLLLEQKKKTNQNNNSLSKIILFAEKLIEESKYDSAEEILEQLEKDAPNNVDVLNNLAVVLILKNEDERAVLIINKILSLDPLNEVALENLEYLAQKYNDDETQFERNKLAVSIIIPSYNNWSYTENCIKSIYSVQNKTPFEIIIVDNNSTDETRTELIKLQQQQKNLRAILNRENLGFAKANNIGVSNAKNELILFLNNDTEPKDFWLDEMVEVFKNNESVGIVGSKLLYPDGTIQHAGVSIVKDELNNLDINPWHIGYRKTDLPEFNKLAEMKAVTAACMMIKKNIFIECNGFDENYWNGYEDVDLCFKVISKKYKIIYQPKSVVTHFESKSGEERFVKESENLKLLLSKWVGKITPDLIYTKERLLIDKKAASIIIVTYNSQEAISNCITSLKKTLRPQDEVVIVDNNSRDNTVKVVDQEIKNSPQFKLIESSENLGFSAGCNLGIENSKNPYVILLNPDTIVTQNWLEKLTEHLNDESITAIGPISNYVAGHQKMELYQKENLNGKNIDEISNYFGKIYPGKNVETKILIGFCLVVRRSFLNTFGMLDPKLFLGNDDLDISWRIRVNGGKLAVAIDTFVFHEGQKSFKTEKKTKTDLLVQESTDALYEKLEKYYGKNNVPTPKELWGMEWFAPTKPNFNPLSKIEKQNQLVSIITLSYNQHEYTKQLVDSIYEYTKVPFELIIIDNASNKDTIKYLNTIENRDEVKIIYNTENQGFPKAVNQGILNSNGNYYLLINNDIVVTENWLARMLEVIELNEQIGLVGPISNAVSGIQLDKEVKYKTIPEMHKYAKSISIKNKGKVLEFPRLAFLCTLIKKEVIDNLGGLDERFSPGNYEDDDFCLRAQKYGYKSVVAQDVFIHHYGSVSFKAEGVEKYGDRLNTNRQIFVNKWGSDLEGIWVRGEKIKNRKLEYPINQDLFKQSVERAFINIDDEEYDNAIENLNLAIENYDISDRESYEQITKTELLNLAGTIALSKNELENAKEYFEEELSQNPESSQACFGLGEVFNLAELYQESKTMFEWAIINDDNNINAIQRLKEINQKLNLPIDDNATLAETEKENVDNA